MGYVTVNQDDHERWMMVRMQWVAEQSECPLKSRKQVKTSKSLSETLVDIRSWFKSHRDKIKSSIKNQIVPSRLNSFNINLSLVNCSWRLSDFKKLTIREHIRNPCVRKLNFIEDNIWKHKKYNHQKFLEIVLFPSVFSARSRFNQF